ncbi:MAG: biotin/lipoyl-binding protein, partial [Gammaproteobacteria bacterium]|nr:biotin/lipoyl-binding protein [Gammaproteobacteria bacterium]
MNNSNKDLLEESLEFLSDSEAIAHRPLPRFARSTVYLLAGLMASIVLWASLSEIDRVVTTRGKLVTTSSSILIQPFVTSVVRSMEVREGEKVKAGQLLGTFDPTFAAADLSRFKAQAKELTARMGRIEAELVKKKTIEGDDGSIEYLTHQRVLLERLAHYRAKIVHFNEAINRLKVNQNANLDDQRILTQRLASAKEIENMESQMAQGGIGSKLKLLLARDQRLEMENELQSAFNQEDLLKHQIITGKAEKTAFIKDWRRRNIEELSGAQAQLHSIEEQIAKAARLEHLSEMRAPVDAVVLR